MSRNCITYRIDRNDVIIFVSDGWQSLAEENNEAELGTEQVTGKSIYDYICDAESRHIYRLLVNRCREANQPITFPFRCDSPDKRRYMTMEMVPGDDSSITFTSCIEHEEAREAVALLEKSTVRSGEFLTICSWCKKIKTGINSWSEVEEAIAQLSLFDSALLPRLTHGMCAQCHNELMEELTKRQK